MGQRRCCICREEMLGWGNDAAPLMDGMCCDACNDKFVIPYRLCKMKKRMTDLAIIKRLADECHKKGVEKFGR